MVERYFDNAATTPVDPRALEAMLPYFRDGFGNAHSLHRLGAAARAAVEIAREHVANLIGAEDPSQIVFTSGATEANNQVARSFAGRLTCSPFEHRSMLEPVLHTGGRMLPNRGWDMEPTECDLSAVMTVNNETGAVLNPPSFEPEGARLRRPLLHRDVTQHVGKLPLSLEGVHYAAFSSHKIYGPKGVGALFCAHGQIDPLLLGGDQEEGRRAGTLNVPAIVGFGMAAVIATDRQGEDFAHAQGLRQLLLDELSPLAEWRSLDHDAQSPFILSLAFGDLEAEPLLHELDARGFQVSSGAACSSRHNEPSHVLTALGIPENWVRGTLRVSFGRSNTPESTQELGRAIVATVDSVRKLLR